MPWPLPTLADAAAGKIRSQSPPLQNGWKDSRDPLTALWMLAAQPQANAVSPPSQGLGAAYRIAQSASSQNQVADYDKPAATPLSDEASPFSSLAQTMRHDSFSKRFPWMGE